MGDREEAGARKGGSQAQVVDGGHHGLAGPCRSDQEVAVMTLFAGEGDEFEKPFLEG